MNAYIKEKIKKRTPEPIWVKLRKIHRVFTYGIMCCLGDFHIDYLVISVGQACNYRCRDCANFCPVSPREYRAYSPGSILSSLDTILSSVSYIGEIQIQGGEPFVYSEIWGVLEHIGRKDRVRRLTVATNGSIVPSDDIMQVMHKYGATVRISNYGRNPDKLGKLIGKCEKFAVKYKMYDFASGTAQWFYCGGLETGREDSKAVVRKRFDRCCFRGCLTLERGELSRCSRASNSYHIQGFDRKEGDYLVVEPDGGFKRKLRKYLIFGKPMEVCHYCYGTSGDHLIPAAIQKEE